MLKTFEKNAIILVLENNMAAKFAYLPRQISDMDVFENDVLVINSHLQADMFNIICKTKTANLQVLRDNIDIFIKENIPFAWWVGFCEEPLNLKHVLENMNLHCSEQELGMAVSIDELACKTFCPELKIRNVNDHEGITDFIKVIAKQVPSDAEAIKIFYLKAEKIILEKNSHLKLFVGYINEKPISTSVLFGHSGVAGIWDVITLSEARGRGVGCDMTLYALKKGQKLGYHIGVLTASEQGQYVYRKLGFKSLQDFWVFNLK